MRRLQVIRFGILSLAAVLGAGSMVRAADPAQGEFFEARIRPVLVRHCYECHSTASVAVKGGLLVDSSKALRNGGETGPAIEPGDPADTLLLQALKHESLRMPPAGKLPDNVIRDFEEWIRRGAFDPRETPPDPTRVGVEAWAARYDELQRWWSYQPLTSPAAPDVSRPDWCAGSLDRFLLARLDQTGLEPAAQASRNALVRRLSFALRGLPPAPAEIEAFVADPDPAAWEHLVDRWLDSPRFGERWARHWMDVVRYSDTYGYEWDMPAKGAWRYRDYLVRAFNQDIPFDQLIREQLAGDLLPSPRIDAVEQINESLIGPMFYQMGEKRHGDSSMFDGIHQEMLDNKIDALSKAFLATTIACARCHDHKLDPIAQREYYALGGMLMSPRWVTNTVDLPNRNAAVREQLKAIKSQLRPRLTAVWRADLEMVDGAAIDAVAAKLPADKPAFDNPFWLWQSVAKAENVAETWTAAVVKLREEQAARVAKNAGHFAVIADFRDGIPAGWSVDGEGLREITPRGDFVVALEGNAAISQILPGGLFTNALSPRLNGAVRTPFLRTLAAPHMSFEVCGGDFAARRTVIDNAFLTELQQYVDHRLPRWEFASGSADKQRQVYFEYATKTSNPNFPPRVGLGGACSNEQIADPRSWFGITKVVGQQAPFAPVDEIAWWNRLLEAPAPTTRDEAFSRYVSWFRGSLETWAADKTRDEDVLLLNALLDAGLLSNRCETGSPVTVLVEEYREAERRLANPWTVNGMLDADPGIDLSINIRGEYDQPGPVTPRGFLRFVETALEPQSAALPIGPQSGRLRLAEDVASPGNPLTARVYVNRVWHWLFGTGLVATPNDFGHLGETPSHPELLDWLAAKFIAEGWSTKRLVREIVLSSAWRQSTVVDPRAHDVDPKNRLLHHYPLRRLEAEELRDALLAVSGRFDEGLYGPPVDPHRAKEDDQKRLFSGPLDGHGRRSLYLKATIMEPPAFLATFNQPRPKIPTGNRDITNTPIQALTLLNDPFVRSQSDRWGTALAAQSAASAAARIDTMFRAALGRSPDADERELWLNFVNDLARDRPGDLLENPQIWQQVAHAMFNLKEFLYLR